MYVYMYICICILHTHTHTHTHTHAHTHVMYTLRQVWSASIMCMCPGHRRITDLQETKNTLVTSVQNS